MEAINTDKEILYSLKNIGKLYNDNNLDDLLFYFNSNNDKVRYWSVKTLGKTNNKKYLSNYVDLFKKETSSVVKREIISSIGRLRDINNIDLLINYLNDSDPSVVLQVIRALLVFKGNLLVDNTLKSLNNDNEIVKSVLDKEYNSKAKTKKNIPHTEVDKRLKNVVVLADTLEAMKLIKEESIHLTFTSPPYYNARDYSIYNSYEDYLNFLDKVFNEVCRITKEGRFLIVNTSPVIVPRISRAHSSKRYPIPFDIHNLLRDKWEFIDDIIWEKPEASVKARNGGFLQHRKPLAYKPNAVTEYLFVYRKKTDKLIDWNIHQYDNDTVEMSKVKGDFETNNVWKIDPTFDKVHSAVFPEALCKRIIEYYSYVGDLVFDPFAGSGTLGKVAHDLNRSFFLTEQVEKYFNRIKERFEYNSIFDYSVPKFINLKEFEEIMSND